MTDEKPKRKTPQKYNPAWKDATRNQRQRDRYERQKELAQIYGFSSWAALVTAMLKGDVILVKKEAKVVE